jgi:hypothetical protein
MLQETLHDAVAEHVPEALDLGLLLSVTTVIS